MNKDYRVLKFVIFLVTLTLLTVIFWKPLITLFSNSENIKQFVLSYGAMSAVIFIILVMLQVVIAPIPGQVAAIAGGYLFGVVKGTLYCMIGVTIGSYIVFLLSNKFGRPFVEKMVNKKILKKFDYIIDEKGVFTLFLIFLMPGLPDDAICFIAGLTKIKIRTLVIISAVGRFPGYFLTVLIGKGFALNNPRFSMIIFGILVLLSVAIFIYRDKLEDTLNHLVLAIKKRF